MKEYASLIDINVNEGLTRGNIEWWGNAQESLGWSFKFLLRPTHAVRVEFGFRVGHVGHDSNQSFEVEFWKIGRRRNLHDRMLLKGLFLPVRRVCLLIGPKVHHGTQGHGTVVLGEGGGSRMMGDDTGSSWIHVNSWTGGTGSIASVPFLSIAFLGRMASLVPFRVTSAVGLYFSGFISFQDGKSICWKHSVAPSAERSVDLMDAVCVGYWAPWGYRKDTLSQIFSIRIVTISLN